LDNLLGATARGVSFPSPAWRRGGPVADDPLQYGNRCGTFRHVYQKQMTAFVNEFNSREQPVELGPRPPVRRMETR
jgi:hypothetical protein